MYAGGGSIGALTADLCLSLLGFQFSVGSVSFFMRWKRDKRPKVSFGFVPDMSTISWEHINLF